MKEIKENKENIDKKKKWKWRLRIVILAILQLGGLMAVMYPFISEYTASKASDSMIEAYNEAAGHDDIDRLFKEAQAYNASLHRTTVSLADPFGGSTGIDKEKYDSVLKVDPDSGMMGYIRIPSIDVVLPIFHGTQDDVLKKGVGHLMGTSLPVGGESTHAVLTGHTGLNSAKLLTDLTEMAVGDMFFISILDRELAYRVTEVNVVEPSDTQKLAIVPHKDLCTLVTCTPYGVNTHRLLVTGERVEDMDSDDIDEYISVSGQKGSQWQTEYRQAIFYGLILAAVLAAVLAVISRLYPRLKKKGDRDGS